MDRDGQPPRAREKNPVGRYRRDSRPGKGRLTSAPTLSPGPEDPYFSPTVSKFNLGWHKTDTPLPVGIHSFQSKMPEEEVVVKGKNRTIKDRKASGASLRKAHGVSESQ